MQVLVCPDAFAGTLSAQEAAHAIAEGLRRQVPGVDLRSLPLSDGGPGFLSTIASCVAGELRQSEVIGPHGEPVRADWLLAGDVAYLESAEVVGLEVDQRRLPMSATSYGVGQLISEAQQVSKTIVLGLGGTQVVDAGAGALAALAGMKFDRDNPLCCGPSRLSEVSFWPTLPSLENVELALDVDVPLLGSRGAALGFAAQKGASETEIALIHAQHQALVDLAPKQRLKPELRLGAGAAGGLGFALMAAGANPNIGADLVFRIVNFSSVVQRADLVITGEGKIDWQTAQGKLISQVAKRTGAEAKPLVAIAGAVTLDRTQIADLGLDAAYSLVDMYGEDLAIGNPAESLAQAASQLARTWLR